MSKLITRVGVIQAFRVHSNPFASRGCQPQTRVLPSRITGCPRTRIGYSRRNRGGWCGTLQRIKDAPGRDYLWDWILVGTYPVCKLPPFIRREVTGVRMCLRSWVSCRWLALGHLCHDSALSCRWEMEVPQRCGATRDARVVDYTVQHCWEGRATRGDRSGFATVAMMSKIATFGGWFGDGRRGCCGGQ